MRKQKLFRGILAGIICLLPFSHLTVQAEDYWPSGPEVQAESAVVMEASTGTVLYEKNPHEQLYPASITKIMTTLLAVENCSLNEEVTFSYESVHNIERDSTHISRDVGEIMTMEQCLYAVMLGSANDCAYAVGEHTGNGYENFIAMMNDKAAQLGCEDTHFNNPHGLPDEQHYTSAWDMALISRAAIKNDLFRMITGTKKYTIPCTNKHKDEETYLVNHHKMLAPYKGVTKYLYDYCIGGKTGFTEAAGSTLVTFGEKDGMTLIAVVMKDSPDGVYTDTRAMMDYCFDNFSMWNVSEQEAQYEIKGTANTEIFGAVTSFADLDREGKIILPKTVAYEEADCKIIQGKNPEDAVAAMQYTYAGRVVGNVEIKRTNAQVEPYIFHMPEEKGKGKEKKSFHIEAKYIVLGMVLVVAFVLIGILIFYLMNNFYIIRHRLQSQKREKKRFKVIGKGRHTKWKSKW